MSIFGYNPMKLYDGRGSFEAMGSGQEMVAGDIAFKSNFAFMNLETGIVERRRVDRTFAHWGVPLCDALNDIPVDGFPEFRIFCQHATEHRCGIKVTGPKLSSLITGTDPLKDNLPLVTCVADDAECADAVSTAQVIDAVSQTITRTLLEQPIVKERREAGLTYPNLVLLRGAS
jgi:2,3-bisphosphoglycerate-independent phosphoglycerate mutase